tara:strand:+ start:51 stop:944 length:894 start_codon:yes stop_codon:yes gene_type:complete
MNIISKIKNRYYNRFKTKDFQSLKKMNQPNLEFIKNTDSSDLTLSNLEEITFDLVNDDIKEIISCFNKNGIVVLPNFLSKELISKIRSSIQPLLDSSSKKSYSYTNNEKDFRKFRKSSPDDLLINERDNKDAGMLDIYNVNKVFNDEIMEELNMLLKGDKIKKLLKSKENNSDFNLTLNAYYNKSVQSTRGFHVDAFYPVIKGMIYLSDVNELESGAYCYVKKSHKPNSLTEINKKISRLYVGEITETPFVEVNELTPVLGKAGTLIFSDQAGAHRGLPQSSDKDRTMLVSKFIAKK